MEGEGEKTEDSLSRNHEERQIAQTDKLIAQLKGQCSGDLDTLLSLVKILQLINKRQEDKYKVSQQERSKLQQNCDSFKRELKTLRDQDLMKNGELDSHCRLKRGACPIQEVPENSKKTKKEKSPSTSKDPDSSDEEFLKPVTKVKLKRSKIITKCDYDKELCNMKSSFERSQNHSNALNEEQRQTIDDQKEVIDKYLNDTMIESILQSVDKLTISNPTPTQQKQTRFNGGPTEKDYDRMMSALMDKEEKYMKFRQSNSELENQMKIKDEELQQLRKDLNDKSHTLGLRDQEIATLAEDINTKNNTIQELEARIQSFVTEKSTLREELSKYEAENSEHLLQIEKERAEKESLKQKCSKLKDYIKDMKNEIQNLREEMKNKIEVKESMIQSLDEELNTKIDELKEYSNDIKVKESTIQELRNDLNEKVEQLQNIEKATEGFAVATRKHKNENVELRKKLEKLEKNIEEIRKRQS